MRRPPQDFEALCAYILIRFGTVHQLLWNVRFLALLNWNFLAEGDDCHFQTLSRCMFGFCRWLKNSRLFITAMPRKNRTYGRTAQICRLEFWESISATSVANISSKNPTWTLIEEFTLGCGRSVVRFAENEPRSGPTSWRMCPAYIISGRKKQNNLWRLNSWRNNRQLLRGQGRIGVLDLAKCQ